MSKKESQTIPEGTLPMIPSAPPNLFQTITYSSGWVCPKCGSVYAPFVRECCRCSKSLVAISFDAGDAL
jgi:hypothetical protein